MSSQHIDKSASQWQYKHLGDIHLDTCYLSPKSHETTLAREMFGRAEAEQGSTISNDPEFCNATIQGGLRRGLSKLLGVNSNSISLQVNTADAVRVIASRYPFASGDKVITYKGDYPSVYEEFEKLTPRGIRCIRMNGELDERGRPIRWSLEELESLIDRHAPAMLSISHVLYRSGFMADLKATAMLCKAYGVRTVVDIAQSIGIKDINPYKIGLDAVVFPMWKGLSSFRGVAVLWTSPEMTELLHANDGLTPDARSMISKTGMTGIDLPGARVFEPSTLPTGEIAAAGSAVTQYLRHSKSAIKNEGYRLQRIFANRVNKDLVTPVLKEDEGGGLILAFNLPKHVGLEGKVVEECLKERVILTQRDGMVRIAPGPLHTTDDEMEKAAEIFNRILEKTKKR